MLDDFGSLEERERSIEVAARTIVALCKGDRFGKGWRPKGVDEVAILLETLGYSQEVVEELWYPNLFAMAADVSALVEKYVADERIEASKDSGWFVRACRDYAAGSLYAGPWVVAVVGLFVFGAALWSAIDTPLELVTTASLGVFGALVVSGYYTQAIARKLAFYFFQNDYAMMRRVTGRFMARGIAALVLAAVALCLVLHEAAGFGLAASMLAGAYLFAAGVFQLSLAPLYTLRRFAVILGIAGLTVLVTGVVFRLGFHGTVVEPWEPMAQSGIIAIAGIAVIAATVRWLQRRCGGGVLGSRTGEPWWPAVHAGVRPYALFGALYFLSILLDHVAAGMLQGGRYSYNQRYEIGAAIGLFAAIPLTGVINVALERLPELILAGAAGYSVGQESEFNGRIVRFFAGSLGAMAAAAVVSWSVVVPIGLRVLEHLGPADPGALSTESRVLELSAAAYAVLMIGLFGSQLQFFLSRPGAALAGALAAVAANGLVGVWAVATHATPVFPVYGLLAGTVAFAVLSLIGAYRALRVFSASYYAAY